MFTFAAKSMETMMSQLTVSYNPNNAFALSMIDLMRKSGVFEFEDKVDSSVVHLAHQYYDDADFERVKARHFFVGEPAPCACGSEAELLNRLAESEAEGVASDSDVEKVFALWHEG